MKHAFIAIALVFAFVGKAHAEPWCSTEDIDDEIVTLAQVCAHEAGLDSPEDCRAIRAVHVALAGHRHTSVLAQVRLYSPRALSGRTSRSWFATMGAWCQVAPSSWPSDLDWLRNERLWFRHYIETERIVLRGSQPECAGTIHDWGCRGCGDHERAQRLGLIPVQCDVETRNDFYARPTMRRREEVHANRMRRIRRTRRSLSPSPRPPSTRPRQRPLEE